MKRLLAVLLAAMLLAAMVPAALATEELEDYTITVLDPYVANEYHTKDTYIGGLIYDKFKIDLDYVPYPGNWQEYLALRLAGKDFPEMFYSTGGDILVKYINAGALICWDDYKEILPNFFSWYPESVYDSGRAYAPDGKLYYTQPVDMASLGNLPDTKPGSTRQLFVRSDLLEEQGWPYICKASDWVEFFKTAKANHPTTEDGLELFVDFCGAESWGPSTLRDSNAERWNSIYFYDYFTYTMQDSWETEQQYESYKFWNTLYREGLLDPECFIDKFDQVEAKGKTTQLMAEWYGMPGAINASLIADGKEQYTYVRMPFVTDCRVDAPLAVFPSDWGMMDSGYAAAMITTNCKNPERLLSMIDYLYTEEGYLLSNWGVEGVDYYFDPETGKPDATPELIELYKNWEGADFIGERGYRDWIGYFAPDCYAKYQSTSMRYAKSLVAEGMTDREKEAYWEICEGTRPEDVYKDGYFPREAVLVDPKGVPKIEIPSSEEDLIDLQDSIDEYSMTMLVRIIMAETEEDFEALYKEGVEGRKSLGIDTLISWYQEQVDGYIAAYEAEQAE